jgi:hypothetical protein
MKEYFITITRYCCQCGSVVEDGLNNGYPYHCPVCDEDMTEYEVNEEIEVEESGDWAKETGRGYMV